MCLCVYVYVDIYIYLCTDMYIYLSFFGEPQLYSHLFNEVFVYHSGQNSNNPHIIAPWQSLFHVPCFIFLQSPYVLYLYGFYSFS